MSDAATTELAQTTRPRPSWYGMDARAVTQQLEVDPDRGLSAGEAAERLRTHGPNKLAGAKKESGFHAFLRQYQDFMQIILLGAAIVNAIVTDDRRDDRPAGGPHGLQRRDRAPAGVQGRGERRGAVEDDEDDRAGSGATGRRSRSTPRSSCPATSSWSRPATAFPPTAASSSRPPSRSRRPR